MSGSGKSTLADYVKISLEGVGASVLILDGDIVRDKYIKKLGFGRSDVKKNNLHVASLCEEESENYDVIIVPIISPYDNVRSIVRSKLTPFFHLIYISTDIDTLKERDTKGLYRMADEKRIDNLLGYSKMYPYEEPHNPDMVINTVNMDISSSGTEIFKYILNSLNDSK
jgi:adenylylsulfate kinase-like enzyme